MAALLLGAVPHAVAIPVAEDDGAPAGGALPGAVEAQSDFARGGRVELEVGAVEVVDDEVVDEELAVGADGQGGGLGGLHWVLTLSAFVLRVGAEGGSS